MDNKFETEVLSRLAVIESKLDDYNNVKPKCEDAYAKSKVNEKDILEINDKIKWLSRTVAGALITATIGIIFIFVKLGMGLK